MLVMTGDGDDGKRPAQQTKAGESIKPPVGATRTRKTRSMTRIPARPAESGCISLGRLANHPPQRVLKPRMTRAHHVNLASNLRAKKVAACP
ncbi:hypothetical protein VTJ04DRAFT_7451 [Mycothermus thermophilus]|uniref:uncharacterized protein n=1 Tax=Humicola insolens TaxID=85995 RepID=UPI0037437AA5